MERSLASKIALLLVAVACVWLDYAVVSGIHRFIWDRQAADIQDMPIHAGVQQVSFYRKARGVFQRLVVYTAAGDGQQVSTHTQIWLCAMH